MWFELRAMEEVTLEGGEAGLVERIRRGRDYDERVVKAQKELGWGSLCSEEWSRDGDLTLHRGRICVPRDPALRHDLVRLHHDTPTAGHPGRWKTLELVSQNYWWLGISRYMAKYIARCDICHHVKSFPTRKVGKLTPNVVPMYRWQVISVDTIGELPDSKGYNAIFVAVDRLSKRIHTIPMVTTIDSTGMARLFLEHVWRHHGLPE
jgi:hypothetical protein